MKTPIYKTNLTNIDKHAFRIFLQPVQFSLIIHSSVSNNSDGEDINSLKTLMYSLEVHQDFDSLSGFQISLQGYYFDWSSSEVCDVTINKTAIFFTYKRQSFEVSCCKKEESRSS